MGFPCVCLLIQTLCNSYPSQALCSILLNTSQIYEETGGGVVKLSEDGNFVWDGKKWMPYEEPFQINPEENEEQEEEIYIPEREFSQPPDWDVMETSEWVAQREFDFSQIALNFHDYEHRKSAINKFGFSGLLLLLIPEAGILLLIVWLVISPITVPIFLQIRSERFYSKREKTIKARTKVLFDFYVVEYQKQMDEANLEMAELESKVVEIESRFE